MDSDEDSKIAVATAWGLRSGGSRRSSMPTPSREGKEKINLDISLLKKQYAKLRERQKQAHIILSAAVTPRPSQKRTSSPSTAPKVNQLLVGKSAILNTKGRRGPPPGLIPPARVKPVKTVKAEKMRPPKIIETLHWKDMDENKPKIRPKQMSKEAEEGSPSKKLV